ncbi:IS1096 element passenger TnpR family protein [Nostoc foliaceum]|uniref:Plasmid pRiA4b ORF-3 family protein n=3 Tax=Nostoc TaxID=1177 RepID=A0ABR8IJT2_9NOSO|nr:plasmid pRiA4b ORF-3 family protein [Nostoc foliaceum]MBD2651107.1 plasmid pRiA4b ORF-3 family protein [Nostoc foliaceum FACHB-393]
MSNLFSLIPDQIRDKLPLTEDKKELLQQQTITQDIPGTILRDFQTILELLQPNGVEVSSTYHQLSLKYLQQLNSQLSYPIDINLKRPVQKSYPYIHGLYFLLRTSGLSQVITEGKESKLVLDQKFLQIWQGLNHTEQYFTLLESWLVWGESELLGDQRDMFDQAYRCLLFWNNLPSSGLKINNYSEQNKLVYYPGFHNLALLHLFGLIELTSVKPQAAKGWRFTHVNPKPWGNALMAVLTESRSNIQIEDYATFRLDFRIAFDNLKPYLQPYFSEWSQTLVIAEGGFTEGVYIFKATLQDAWRRIAIPSYFNLDEVAAAIVQAFDFDPEHLYRFIHKDRLGRTLEFNHPVVEIPPDTCDFRLGGLSLEVGSHLQFIFDLLQEWEFDLYVEKIEPANDKMKKPKILESHGKPPAQYGEEGESWE